MANSFVRYTGNNSTTSYSIPFSYRSTADLIVTLSGSTTTAFTLNGAGTTLTFNSAPAQDAAIEIRRKTSQGTKLVDYASGSVLTENDLDTDSDQAFFMSQEAIDDAGDVIKISNTDFQWDAQSKRLTNVADPTAAQHAATKNYLENTWLSATDKATLTNVNSNISAINTVNSNMSAITTTNSNATNINTVATNIASVNTVATDITKVIAVANDLAEAVSEVETVANDLNESTSEIDTVANAITNVDLVGNNITNVNTVAGISANITTVAGIHANVTTVAGMNSAISSVNSNSTNINAVAGAITNINTVAGANTNITAVATNITGVNSFAERYRVQAGVPSSSNDLGDLVFDTTAGKLKVFDGSSYALAGSSVNGTSDRFKYVATAGQTTFSGADANGNTLTYDVASGTAFADIYLNGVKLDATDFTATNGTSIVLGSGATVNDILQIVAYGTFTLSSFSASNLTSGTINNDRLPSPLLTVKGDGSSTDGAIQLNCSQNSHGVKIKSPPHSAGQSYTLTLPQSITNGYYLKTDGTGNLSFAEVPQPVVPTVADVSQTIAPATATTINITGTNFVSIPIVEFIKTDGSVTLANTVSFTSATSLSVNVTLATGNYHVRVENPDGNAGRSTNNILTASASPSFSTSAGSLGTFAGNFSGTVATIAGSSDSAITFSEVGSNLTTANVTLNTSNGQLTTTDFGGASTTPTTYNFTIRITDAENQTTDRAFSFTSSFGATGSGGFN
ncbi:tail fiber protein [uncultured phage_MedDCM-OCT-S35-C6]|uniref:Tail fiber n=1 Tax=uncultured phage_MedDCM-OCT-S35-C6 TaxID=2741075 RepID=A0A6S4PG54_9CAUD|nr:tail fiber protein [uncultured phage_MedDCM-OCT-S35-C6]BAQ94163.1 tail fiber [uncultured phage_MedDCM-OCT-S35-C6]